MNQVESSVSEFPRPRSVHDVKQKSKKQRKTQPDDVAHEPAIFVYSVY